MANRSPFAWKKISSRFLDLRLKWCHLKDKDAGLNRWRKCFSDLINPVEATPTQIHEEQVGKGIQITEAGVNAVIKSLKTGKEPGEMI